MTARLEKKRYTTDLNSRQWELLKPLIPHAKHGGRPRKHNMKDIIDAILYKVKTGCHWHLIPNDFLPEKQSLTTLESGHWMELEKNCIMKLEVLLVRMRKNSMK